MPPYAELGFAVDAGRVDGDRCADIVVGLPGYRRGDGGIALIRGGPDDYADEGHVLGAGPKGEGHRFGTAVALPHLAAGGEAPDIAVVAEDAGFDGLVQVIRGEAEPTKPCGLARAAEGDSGETRLGLTAGA